MGDSDQRHTETKVRYYPVDFENEKFPQREMRLQDYKDVSLQALIKLRDRINIELVKRRRK